MRRRFPSDSYAAEKKSRLRRIRNRACSSLSRAFESGQLSLRQYDLLSRRPTRQQKRIIAAERSRSVTALVAAQTINQFLDSLEARTPISLRELAGAVRNAVQQP
jgi:hypothetical protein